MYGGYDGSATQFAGNGGGFMATPTGATDAATGAAGGVSLSSHPLSWHRPMSRFEDVVREIPTGRPRRSSAASSHLGTPLVLFKSSLSRGSILTFSHPLRLSFPQRGQGRPDSLVPVTVKMLQTAIAASNVVRSRTDSSPHASIDAPLPISDPTRDFKPAQLCF
jgi:hypothetical protein